MKKEDERDITQIFFYFVLYLLLSYKNFKFKTFYYVKAHTFIWLYTHDFTFIT